MIITQNNYYQLIIHTTYIYFPSESLDLSDSEITCRSPTSSTVNDNRSFARLTVQRRMRTNKLTISDSRLQMRSVCGSVEPLNAIPQFSRIRSAFAGALLPLAGVQEQKRSSGRLPQLLADLGWLSLDLHTTALHT